MDKIAKTVFAQKGTSKTFSGAFEYKRPRKAQKARVVNPGRNITLSNIDTERRLHNGGNKTDKDGKNAQHFLCPSCHKGYLGKIVQRVRHGENRMVRLRKCSLCDATAFTEEILLSSLYDAAFANRLEWIAVTATQDVRRAKQLLHNQPSLLDAQDSKGNTALVRAMLSKSYEMFSFLLNSNCSLFVENKRGENAIDIAEQQYDEYYLKSLLVKKTYSA